MDPTGRWFSPFASRDGREGGVEMGMRAAATTEASAEKLHAGQEHACSLKPS